MASPSKSTSSAAKKTPAKKTPAKKAVVAVKAAPAKKTAETAKKAAPAKQAATKEAAVEAPTEAAPVSKAPAVKKAAPAKAAPVKKAASVTKAAPAKKATPMSPYDATFIEAQREMLHTERARFTRDITSLMDEANELAAMREPGDVQFDEESGEGDTLAVERERDLALSAQFLAQVEEIDRALEKIELGTYGVCEVSGDPIPVERLEAIPWVRERVEYKVGGFARR